MHRRQCLGSRLEPLFLHHLESGVVWRKQTAGTRSERGNLFAERVMTVVHTLRKQGRHVLSYLEQACEAASYRQPTPALMPDGP